MTPLEAAKALNAADHIVHFECNGSDYSCCWHCHGAGKDQYDDSHEPDCPVPMLPQIVAALDRLESLGEELA